MNSLTRIGAVDGSVEAGTRRFHVVLDDDATVQLDDLLVCRQDLPAGGEVVPLRHRHRADRPARGRAVAVGHPPRGRRGRCPGERVRRARGAACCAPSRRCGSRPSPARSCTRRRGEARDEGAVRRPDAQAARGRARPVGRAGARRLHVHERRAGRPRVDLGHQRRRGEDVLRAVPAAHDLRDARGPGAAGRARGATRRRSCSTSRARTCCTSTAATACSPTTSAVRWARAGGRRPAAVRLGVVLRAAAGGWRRVAGGAGLHVARRAIRSASTAGRPRRSSARGCCASASPRPTIARTQVGFVEQVVRRSSRATRIRWRASRARS